MFQQLRKLFQIIITSRFIFSKFNVFNFHQIGLVSKHIIIACCFFYSVPFPNINNTTSVVSTIANFPHRFHACLYATTIPTTIATTNVGPTPNFMPASNSSSWLYSVGHTKATGQGFLLTGAPVVDVCSWLDCVVAAIEFDLVAIFFRCLESCARFHCG